MSSAEHVDKFINDLVAARFMPPRYDKPEERDAWLRTMVAALRGTTPEVLAQAAQIMIEERTNRYFPLIADCREAIRRAADQVAFEKRKQTLPLEPSGKERVVDYSGAHKEWVVALLRGELGRRAAKEHWHLALYDFTMRMGRLPDNRRYEGRYDWERIEHPGCTEIEFCKRSALGFDEAHRATIRGEAGAWSSDLAKLGDAIAEKRQALAQRIMAR